jgi:hypothetical protein
LSWFHNKKTAIDGLVVTAGMTAVMRRGGMGTAGLGENESFSVSAADMVKLWKVSSVANLYLGRTGLVFAWTDLGLATESEEGKEGGVCFGCHRWWGQLEDVVGDVDADVSSIRHVGKKYESLWMESREGGEALNGTVSVGVGGKNGGGVLRLEEVQPGLGRLRRRYENHGEVMKF